MFSVTTPLQIKNNPINNSSAKHQWSFSKSQRFPRSKSYCNQSCYDIPNTISKRKTSLGFGGRAKHFEGKKHTPQPTKYQLQSDIDINKKKAKGFNFRQNRQNLIFDHFQKIAENTPAPSTYEGDSNQIKKKRAYSMRPKTAYPTNYFLPNKVDVEKKKTMPGPGKYETIDQIGSKYHTRDKNTHARSFHGRQRFRKQKMTPGPSDYKNTTIQPDGIYLLSTMKGSGRRAILNGRRDLKMDGNKQTPGPGTYRAPSDFGHYEEPLRPSTARK